MTNNPKVVCLVTVTDEKYFEQCTLSLKYLRTAFPTFPIEVWINGLHQSHFKVRNKCDQHKLSWYHTGTSFHHADWIEQQINNHDGTLIIADPDIMFHENIEHWGDTFDNVMHGHYVPEMWNEFASCPSMARLHTELLWIPDTVIFRNLKAAVYPTESPYNPVNIYHPQVVWFEGEALFYDTMSMAYHMLGGTPFTHEHLAYYDHCQSSSFVKVMSERMEKGKEFWSAHELLSKEPEIIKGNWKNIELYYAKMQQVLSDMIRKEQDANSNN